METPSQISNLIFGTLSVLSIISGFLLKDYQYLFWIGGAFLLVITTLSYYIFDTRNKLIFVINKFKKVEETLNIYNRLNRLELRMNKRNKNAQVNIIDIIKIGLALILIYAFIQAIKSL